MKPGTSMTTETPPRHHHTTNSPHTNTNTSLHSTKSHLFQKALEPPQHTPRSVSSLDVAQNTNETTLHLNSQSLRVIPPNVALMRHLKLLNLSHNSIISLLNTKRNNGTDSSESATFDRPVLDLPYLEKLFLQDNAIACIEGLRHLRSLRILNLSNNTLHIVSNIEALSNLRVLDLSENQISLFDNDDVFRNLAYLEYLDLSSNMLKELPQLSHNHKLHTLKLANNFLSDDIWMNMRAERALPMDSIHVLHLQRNEFKSISPFHTLRKFANLRELNVANNPVCDKAAFNNVDLRPLYLYMLPQLERLVVAMPVHQTRAFQHSGSATVDGSDALHQQDIHNMDVDAIREQYRQVLRDSQIDALLEDGAELSIMNLLGSICPMPNGSQGIGGNFTSRLKNLTTQHLTHDTYADANRQQILTDPLMEQGVSQSNVQGRTPSSMREQPPPGHMSAHPPHGFASETQQSPSSTKVLSPNVSHISPATPRQDQQREKPHHKPKPLRNILPSPGGLESPVVPHPSVSTGHTRSSSLEEYSAARREIRTNVLAAHRAKRDQQIAITTSPGAASISTVLSLQPGANSPSPTEYKRELVRLQKQVKEMRQFYKILLKSEHHKRKNAAIKIQRAYRYYQVKKLFHKERELLQQKREQRLRKRMDSRFIQWRQLFSRPKAAMYNANSADDAAAARIQAMWRGYKSRKQVRQFVQQDSAAHVIQFHWKKHKARTDKFYRLQQRLEEEVKTRQKLQEALRFLWTEVSELRAWKEEQMRKEQGE